jgi:hypothetical protein
MTRFDQYLRAVGLFLPRAQRNDIIQELSEEIRSQIEDREAELGRSLTAAEQATLIRQFGHPALLAGRYGPRQHLIGPEVFPIYRFVLTVALSLAAVIHIVIAMTLLVSGKPTAAIRQATLILPAVAFLQFGVITLVFAAADRRRSTLGLLEHWSPRDCRADADTKRIQNAFAGLVAGVFFGLWWIAAGRYPILILGPGAAVFKLAPVWKTVYVPILLLALAGTVKAGLDLIRPRWTRLRVTMGVVITGGGVIVMALLMQAGTLVVLAGPLQPEARYDRLMNVINDGILWTLASAIGISVLVAVLEIRRIVRGDLDVRVHHV